MCSDPIFMVNQELKRCFRDIESYLIDGVYKSVLFLFNPDDYKKSFDDFKKYWYDQANFRQLSGYSKQDVFENYFARLKDGRYVPLFLLAPCGHCAECRMAYASELKSRLQLEFLANCCRPIVFLTLTYADRCLPKNGVDQDELVHFINRFRDNCANAGFNRGWRIFYVSEYGTDPNKTRRPHYHLLIFGVDFDSIHQSYKLFSQKLRQSWTFGRTEWELGRNNYALCAYVTKYVTKSVRLQDNVPEGKNPNFWRGPSRGGGLGIGMLDYIKDNFDYLKDTDCLFRTPFGIWRIRVPKFILDKICPPLSRHVSKRILDYVRGAFKSWYLLNKVAPALNYDISHLESPARYLDSFSGFISQKMIREEYIEVDKMLGLIDLTKKYSKYLLPLVVDGKPLNIDLSHNTDYVTAVKLDKFFIESLELYKFYCNKIDKFLTKFTYNYDQYLSDLYNKEKRFVMQSRILNKPSHCDAVRRYGEHIAVTPFSLDIPYDDLQYSRVS